MESVTDKVRTGHDTKTDETNIAPILISYLSPNPFPTFVSTTCSMFVLEYILTVFAMIVFRFRLLSSEFVPNFVFRSMLRVAFPILFPSSHSRFQYRVLEVFPCCVT